MRDWDAVSRRRAALVAVHAAALALLLDNWSSAVAAAVAALAGACTARSLLLARPPGRFVWSVAPTSPGGLVLGRGAPWGNVEAVAFLETGRPVPRPERELVLPDAVLDRHAILLGTTGCGKSRLLELMAVQAIGRGDAVVVVDPKGDDGLLSRVRRAAGDRFRLLSLAHPERSERYNPVGRYRDVREVADRVAALLPSSGDSLPFRNFAWDIVHTTARELHGKRPVTLRNLKRHGIDRPVGPLASRPREHFLKMASSLIPILAKLGSDLLSPEQGGLSWEEVDRRRGVVFLSLSALLGQESAAAVGKMAILDLASYVGARYAYAKGHGPIWLFVDELADVATVELVGLLAKSRGAGLRIVAAAQSAADLEVALGDRARAQQALANLNATIQFKAQSARDAEHFSAMAGDRLLPARSEGADYEPSLLGSGLEGVHDFRARFGERTEWREAPLLPPWALAELPPLHFYGRWEGNLVRGRVPLPA
jgi:conjugal transfer pilus assembly protein TraD